MKPSCQTCAFFIGSYEDRGTTHGYCARYPPRVVAEDVVNEGVELGRRGVTRWPEVIGSEWCGEHRERVTEGEAGSL